MTLEEELIAHVVHDYVLNCKMIHHKLLLSSEAKNRRASGVSLPGFLARYE